MIKSLFWNILEREILARKCTYEIVRIDNKGVYIKVVKDHL